MSKLRTLLLSFLAVSAVAAAAPAAAVVVGPDAGACASGRPSMVVHVSGFKQGAGTVKLAIYGSDPHRYLAKKGKIRKVVVPVRSTGPLDVCIAVPGPGRYAVAVHHDINGNGSKDRKDGGGYSGNPKLTITSLRPAFSKTSVAVGRGPRKVGVTLQYLKGLSIRPVDA